MDPLFSPYIYESKNLATWQPGKVYDIIQKDVCRVVFHPGIPAARYVLSLKTSLKSVLVGFKWIRSVLARTGSRARL